ncbi:MAG: hypothetical protein GY950_15095 [bacterium]|nr:hypothetical protein [bacterium]
MSSNNNKKKPEIVFTKHSPYMVADLENLFNAKGEKLRVTPVTSLCRCGLSKRKPCCDGSHTATGIDGEKQPDRVKDKTVAYKGKDITIHDNRGVCSHDRSCVNDLPSVFKRGERRWIQPDNAGVKDIIETIEKCPSGALSYSIGHLHCTELKREPAIKVAKNGPLEITGGIKLKDDIGSKPQSNEHYTLCRCGGSKNKPFCDGAHLENGFEDNDN